MTQLFHKLGFAGALGTSFIGFWALFFFGHFTGYQMILLAVFASIGLVGWYYSLSYAKKTSSTLFNAFQRGDFNFTDTEKNYFSQIPGFTQVIDDFNNEKQSTTRLNFAIECVTSSVMVADNQYNIVYCNPSMMTAFRKVEADIRKVFSQFDVNKLIGTNMDIFHKNPAHQGGLVSSLKETVKTRIKVGPCTFDLVASPIFDKNQKRHGTVIEWKEITAELKVEEEISSLVAKVSTGDFSYRIELSDKQGFMRTLAEGMNKFTDVINNSLTDILGFLSGLSEGNLSTRMKGEYAGMLEEIKQNANYSVEKLEGTIANIIEGTKQIREASGEISAGSNDLSERTETQASSLEETAASIEEITAAVKSNSENAQRATKMSSDASGHASTGERVIEEAVQAMGRIQESSQKIGEITNLIDEIAFQTNLLALNASVEAARAGDFGKGFAVVAQEVRALAEHSAQASKQIKALIESSSESVQEGSDLVVQAKHSLASIVTSIKEVSEIIHSINLASSEQSVSLDQINQTVTQLDAMTQKNAALVTENVATTASMDEQAESLRDMLGFFKIGQTTTLGQGRGSGTTSQPTAYH